MGTATILLTYTYDAIGNIAVGDAVKQAIDPQTGEIDRNMLAGILKQSTAGSMKAIPTLNALETLRTAGYQEDQQGLDTFQKRMAITHHLFSGIASKTNPTMDDVYDVATKAMDPGLDAKKYGITLPVIMNALKQFRGPDGKPLPPAEIRKKALEIQTHAATTAEILEQHSPRYGVVDQGNQYTLAPYGTAANPDVGTAIPKGLGPNTIEYGPKGPVYRGEQPPVPGGGVVTGTGQPVVPTPQPRPDVSTSGPYGSGAPVTNKDLSRVPPPPGSSAPIQPNMVRTTSVRPAAGYAPGFESASNAVASSSAANANRLAEAADGANSRKGMLGNLEDDLTKFTTGQGADWTRIAKNFANRNLPVPDSWKKEGAILDEGSVAGQEQFNKQAMMIAQSQFSTIGGTGTDAKFNSAFETSPNETLTQLGNQGIIRLLKGNEDAIIAKNKSWQKWLKDGNGPQTYQEFSADFNQHFDPRVFQFKYIPDAERNAYINKMDPVNRDQFLHDLTYARLKGWVNFEAPKGK